MGKREQTFVLAFKSGRNVFSLMGNWVWWSRACLCSWSGVVSTFPNLEILTLHSHVPLSLVRELLLKNFCSHLPLPLVKVIFVTSVVDGGVLGPQWPDVAHLQPETSGFSLG
jgi:hypothetical protein